MQRTQDHRYALTYEIVRVANSEMRIVTRYKYLDMMHISEFTGNDLTC